MGGQHARLAPSDEAWPFCAPSVHAQSSYPNISGAAAIDGTGSHLLLENCLKHDVRAEAYLGQIIGVNHEEKPNGWYVEKDRCERVQMCLDYLVRRHRELNEQYPKMKILIQSESRSDPGAQCGRDDWNGTVDITITVWNGDRLVFIEICDYKDGRLFVPVEYKYGKYRYKTQLTSYASGKIHFESTDWGMPLRVTVVQPKTAPVIRYADMTVGVLYEEFKKLSEAAHATDDPNAPYTPDDKGGKGHCRWCRHRENCEGLNNQPIQAVKIMTNEVATNTNNLPFFEQLTQSVVDVKSLTNEQISQLLDCESPVQAIFKKIKDEAQARTDTGQTVSGYGYTDGKKQRVYSKSPEEVEKALKARKFKKSEIYPSQLISPAQVLASKKLDANQKKRFEKEYITEKYGKKTFGKVARVSQEEQTIEEMFGDIAATEKTVIKKGVTPSLFDDNNVSFL